MNQKRIYGEKTAINTEHIRNFYEKRAAVASVGDIGAVLLGNQNSDFLNKRNAYDQEYILPMLGITSETRVLDIGCGIGRWASFILPKCQFYCGVDFSAGMVSVAERVCQGLGGNYALHCMPATEVINQDVNFYGGLFGTVIASGVFMYINDQEVAHIIQCLSELLNIHCTIYLADPVGVSERLTLNDFSSEALQTDYSAIYRTVDEYLELCAPLFDAGFSVVKREFLPQYGESYSDTSRYYMILKR